MPRGSKKAFLRSYSACETIFCGYLKRQSWRTNRVLKSTDLDRFRVRIVHLIEWTVARVDRHLHPHQRLQPVRVRHPGGPNLEPEASGGRVDVEGVLHQPLLAAQEDDLEGGVAGGWNHLEYKVRCKYLSGTNVLVVLACH